ncbi:unnamed protein product [Caenorhabditis angaria]|uniref:Uncharacterized protein n=1 Tax=Caenorhabditis angaria TaxID=860376 RepID=A0A9P1IC57_9PELO|nr:unnamed protein product [Caenorhabditis angaria]
MDPNDVVREGVRVAKSYHKIDKTEKHSFHRDTINSLCTFRNSMVLSGSRDKTIALNNCDTADVSTCWTNMNSEVTKLSFRAQAGGIKHTVMSGSRDGTVNMWVCNSPNPIKTIPGAHRMIISGLVIRNDDEFVSGSRDGHTKLWDIETGKCIFDTQTSRNLVTHMCNTTRNLIGQSSEDKTVKLWDPRESTPVHTFARKQHIQMHCDQIDENYIASCSNGFNNDGCEITFYDLRLTKPLRELKGHEGSVTCIAPLQLNDKKLMVSVGLDKTIRLWKIDDGTLVWTEESPFDADNLQCCCYSDGHVVISGGFGRLALYHCKYTAGRPCLIQLWVQKTQINSSSSNQRF